MAKAQSWEEPGAANWVDAQEGLLRDRQRQRRHGGRETVPFSDRGAAERFASENGGRVVTFADVPRDYVLGTGETTGAGPAPPDERERRHTH